MLHYLDKLNNNPIYFKEIKIQGRINSRRKLRIPSWSGYLAILLLPLALTLMLNTFKQRLSLNDLRSVFMISVFLQVLYYIYRAASHAWGLISGEKEMKTYGNLISTGMSPDEIVKGKFWAAFFPLAKELTLLFPVFTAIGMLLQIPMLFLFLIYFLTVLFTAFFSMVGTYFSAREKTTAQSRENTVRTIAGLLVGTYIAGGIMMFLLSFLFSSLSMYLFYSSWFAIPSVILSALSPLSSLWATNMIIISSNLENTALLIYLGYILITLIFYLITIRVLYRKTVKRIGEIPG